MALVKSRDRAAAIGRAVDLLGTGTLRGKAVLLKPNLNTADPFPASTHNDTLNHLIRCLQSRGARSVTVGERSGPPDTGDVIREKGVDRLCGSLGAGLVNFEDLPPSAWVRVAPEQSHWRSGFDVPQLLLDAECVVTTCCLKTHAYGGVFSMSLKLAVGFTHKRNMAELHTSFRNMRRMIAEVNQAFRPSLVLLDGIDAFVDGGPMSGPVKRPDVILAGEDRVAVDAVGLAVLKEVGSNRAIMGTRIFGQEQIARAAELGLGVSRPDAIEILADDAAGRHYAERVTAILLAG